MRGDGGRQQAGRQAGRGKLSTIQYKQNDVFEFSLPVVEQIVAEDTHNGACNTIHRRERRQGAPYSLGEWVGRWVGEHESTGGDRNASVSMAGR